MTRDLDFPIEIVVCPTIREKDRLAMSSRNVYLNTEERKAALVLSRGLFKARSLFEAGTRDSATLRRAVLVTLETEPLVMVQYVSCADPYSLQELEGQIDKALISLAVVIGKTRLIDNVVVGED